MRVSQFKIDKHALAEAIRYLGLAGDARVAICGMEYAGRYVKLRGWTHCLSVSAYLDTDTADWVLWHELTHARQVEQCGSYSLWDGLWTRQMVAAGFAESRFNGGSTELTPVELEAYNSTRFEAEANKVADSRPDHIRIAVAR